MHYTCPMHPEVQQSTPGRCSICHMKLVKQDEVAHMSHADTETKIARSDVIWKNYIPLAVIIGIITLVSVTLSYRDALTHSFQVSNLISYFMTGFFLTFASFKLIDIRGFAEGYATYDLLAQKWFPYGYIYPFIELFFGISMLLLPHATLQLVLEIGIMLFSGIGVSIKIARGERFQCACLGTFLKVPLTKVTLIEDFGMALLAGTLLFLR